MERKPSRDSRCRLLGGIRMQGRKEWKEKEQLDEGETTCSRTIVVRLTRHHDTIKQIVLPNHVTAYRSFLYKPFEGEGADKSDSLPLTVEVGAHYPSLTLSRTYKARNLRFSFD
jgi:hypothetical protein